MSLRANKAYATEDSSNTEVSMNVDSVINISSPEVATLNCEAGATAAAAQLCTTDSVISVSTNNQTGYTLQMNATSGSPNALTNSATSPASTIPTLSQAYAPSSFPTNSWGYTGGSDKSSETGGYDCTTAGGNYCPILAYESTASNYAPNHTIKVTDAPATASNTTITFGAKVDISKPSGTYTSSVTFTAVANALPGPSLDGMNMQDIDSSVCASVTDIDTTYTVIDTRDGTEYTIAKLQDGNCWMTQNLELGSTAGATALTSADSNVSSSGYSLTPADSTYKGNSNKYGNFYTFAQATAGSGSTTSGVDAQYDICPKNWRLPSASTSTTNSEFYLMLNHYLDSSKWNGTYWDGVTTSQFTDPPVSLVFSGNWYGSFNGQGNFGVWWPSTSNGSYNAFYLSADSYGYVYPRDYYGSRVYGFTVRCLVPGSS